MKNKANKALQSLLFMTFRRMNAGNAQEKINFISKLILLTVQNEGIVFYKAILLEYT
ncbi:MAG: hypothetical protein KGO92_00230 [Bacteroidota bacterium]|nr:hypothetical protein [Bacteroidota bacterium]